jgi:diguanylate cyclase (GGDEF)-like protein
LISYILFTVPTLLPLSVALLLFDQTQVQGIGVLMVFFFIITLRQVLQIHSVLKQSITNGLELEQSKEQTEQLAQELYQQSTMDALTSVTNRRGFDEALSAEWLRARRSGKPLTLLMIDVDCFKPFNDNLGHLAGDECLQQLASTLRSHVKRAGETIARFGGEEFAVLLPDTTAEEGVCVAEKIRESVFELNIPHPASDVADRVTVSAGVYSVAPDQMQDSHQLIKQADQALYQAKADGRNCIRQA